MRYLRVDAGSGAVEVVEAEVNREASVALTVNGEAWLTFLCTPFDLEALAVGFLFNEGVIESAAEVADVRVCDSGDNIDVWLNRLAERPQRWSRTSGCAGGVTCLGVGSTPLATEDGSVLEAETVGRLIELLYAGQRLHRQGGGVHASALSDGREMCLVIEDMGRHNTLDKLAGWCLLRGVETRGWVLVTTGRISSEMLHKAVRMKTPLVISRSAPTSLSVALAEELGITLVGYARGGWFNVYTHPRRIGIKD